MSTQSIKATHVALLLDRSGSMAPLVSDVIGGVNQFLTEQRAQGNDVRVSIVQFDSNDPQEVKVWGAPISEVGALTTADFQPRGGTPLLDATGLLIGRVKVDAQSRVAAGLAEEDIVFVTVTDGEENQSREFTLAQVKALVETQTAAGWTFVFLSAGLNAYGDAAAMGFDASNSQAWDRRGDNTRMAFDSVSKGMTNLREKKRRGMSTGNVDFFETGKDAEENI
jgi:Mg-chelatase subunit ChlD